MHYIMKCRSKMPPHERSPDCQLARIHSYFCPARRADPGVYLFQSAPERKYLCGPLLTIVIAAFFQYAHTVARNFKFQTGQLSAK